MSWLFFQDESGHDHRTMPYEVRGGVAIHAKEVWPFVQAVQTLEEEAFGASLAQFKREFKGAKLLDRDRFAWARQADPFDEEKRRICVRRFLAKGAQKASPARDEFTAYGQACLLMTRGLFRLLVDHQARLFASAIPRGVKPPPSKKAQEFLRKDHVFLLERLYYFLEEEREHGLLVMDRVEDENDRRFVRQMEAYFTKTEKGILRTRWIVPSPLFVSSAMSVPVQAADVCVYCVNWGFRLPTRGMDAPTRPEIAQEFGGWLNRLQYQGTGSHAGSKYATYGIVFVLDPYTSR